MYSLHGWEQTVHECDNVVVWFFISFDATDVLVLVLFFVACFFFSSLTSCGCLNFICICRIVANACVCMFVWLVHLLRTRITMHVQFTFIYIHTLATFQALMPFVVIFLSLICVRHKTPNGRQTPFYCLSVRLLFSAATSSDSALHFFLSSPSSNSFYIAQKYIRSSCLLVNTIIMCVCCCWCFALSSSFMLLFFFALHSLLIVLLKHINCLVESEEKRTLPWWLQ